MKTYVYTSATATIRWRVVLQLWYNRCFRWTFFIIDRSRIPYQEKGFIRIKTVSFHSGENITYSVFLKINFIVPISSIQLQISILTSFTQTKGTIQSVWSDLMTSILPHWLTPPLLFFLCIYLRYHPDGLGGSVNHCIVNLTTLHPYSINFSFTNPNNEPLNKPMKLFPSLTRRALVNSGLLNIIINK